MGMGGAHRNLSYWQFDETRVVLFIRRWDERVRVRLARVESESQSRVRACYARVVREARTHAASTQLTYTGRMCSFSCEVTLGRKLTFRADYVEPGIDEVSWPNQGLRSSLSYHTGTTLKHLP